MEARKASGPAVKKGQPVPGSGTDGKKASSPTNVPLVQTVSPQIDLDTDSGSNIDSNAGKRIVEKLRSDVKGLRNAIRRSRKSNSRYLNSPVLNAQ